MAALLADLGPGDEVIVPSYTFVSTASAFALRGARIVFVDVRPDTFNMDETRLEAAISERTRAIVPVHYAGVPANMAPILALARRYNLLVIEDAAQAVLSTYRGRPAGSLGHLAALSFHETKNVSSGEGGALLINDNRFVRRAEILWEKGTNRAAYFRGEVDKYTWVDVGSSFLPGELIAAFLWAQLEEADAITARRLNAWREYHRRLARLEREGILRRPIIPVDCEHNAHMYYILMPDLATRQDLIQSLAYRGIHSVFHYVPLHSAPAGLRHGRCASACEVSTSTSNCLLRLPMYVGVESEVERITDEIETYFASRGRRSVA
jgi:dTDP-4-amino-4,6-dideoxygalactose transaminase